ncbi:MAG: alpha/beta hydrolase [Acidimicrobiales bacterium]|nr:alpha/beta hydrolase [Acidimicrobiales bacterium]HRW38415.1 dienelactone hydrolase family protein [Aquihabitans sp.]
MLRTVRSHRTLALVLTLSLAVASCASDGGSEDAAGGGDASTTTTAAASSSPAYAARGPHEVGVHSFALDDGRRVVSWYPAAASAADQPDEVFDIASLLSPELQSQVPAELRPQYEIAAHPGAEPADDGPFPVVLFSHGFAGFPEQSADLVTHLASWGFVVVAPAHVERSLDGLLGTGAQGIGRRDDPEVLMASLDAALADEAVGPLIDDEQVAVAGHSAGASAAYLAAASDDRVDALVAYALGDGRQDPDQPAPDLPVPDVPSLVMLGTDDGIIPAGTTRAVWEQMAPPKRLVELGDAGHLAFSDICLIGRDQGGLTGLVEEAGLDLPADLLRLASDGCEPDALDPEAGFAPIDHLTVAFLRSAFGIDPEPVGLDETTAAQFSGVDVTLREDLG